MGYQLALLAPATFSILRSSRFGLLPCSELFQLREESLGFMMKEDIAADYRAKFSRFSNQNQSVKANTKGNGNSLKPKSASSWGSQIVKGFTTEKKSKLQSAIPNKKIPLVCSDVSDEKNQYASYHSRVKRSLISDFPCSVNAAQVHPHSFECHRIRSPASHDLFIELDHLRNLLQESREREIVLQAELQDYKQNSKVLDLEKELDLKRGEIQELVCKVSSLEAERKRLSEQLTSLCSTLEHQEEINGKEFENTAGGQMPEKMASQRNLEMEVVELRRLNKELQFQKRNLAFRLSSAESQLAGLVQSDIVAKVEAEASVLRHTNEDLCKQVEGLQVSRLNEVEELAYLRWINSCLRHELCNSDSQYRISTPAKLEEALTSKSNNTSGNTQCEISIFGKSSYSFRKSLSREFFEQSNGALNHIMHPDVEDKWNFDFQGFLHKNLSENNEGTSPSRRHSISGSKGYVEDLKVNTRRQSDGFICQKELKSEVSGSCLSVKDRRQIIAQKYELGMARSPKFHVNKRESGLTSQAVGLDVEKCALRIPNPPPRPSGSIPHVTIKDGTAPIPPPPPPPPKLSIKKTGGMQRAPQVVELYHSLMKRESRKDSGNGGVSEVSNVANVRSSMIGEIENRSSHLLAIKSDVETKSEFVKSLIKEVNSAVYHNIEDVIAFVKWLDDELSFLVDERAVLKHFDWPEKKADTLREAAFGYRDLKKLESEVTHYVDDLHLPCDVALKKMVALSEKMERGVYNLLRTRDALMRHCKEFEIPTDWMLDTGIIGKASKKYMKRVAMELHAMGASDKDPALEYTLLQGVRFAFRIHQFAGGFDAETMHAFEELRNLAHPGTFRCWVEEHGPCVCAWEPMWVFWAFSWSRSTPTPTPMSGSGSHGSLSLLPPATPHLPDRRAQRGRPGPALPEVPGQAYNVELDIWMPCVLSSELLPH
ncbi:hypothetical protein Taro_031432, partial [Colocasia esculenta]|nr:hypothetical protein [Colocasia esculenta]